MSLWKIAWRSIQQRALSSSLTALSMALGVALVVTVLVMHSVVSDSFAKGARGYNVIVGAKGGSLDLVLNTVYHLGKPVGNIPWSYYKEFKPGGKYASSVAAAIPVCLGDNYEGYRVVGTVPQLFELEYASGERYSFEAGRNFEQDHFFEAVIGSMVARNTGLTVGSKFEPSHGVTDDGQGHKHDAFKVVGVLAPTGTPNDRALFVNMEGFFLLEGHAKEGQAAPAAKHDHEGHEHKKEETGGLTAPAQGEPKPAGERKEEADHKHEAGHKHDHAHDHAHEHEHVHHDPLPEDQREVTAVLVRTKSDLAAMALPRSIAREPMAQAVFPAPEIHRLFEGLVGNLRWLLLALAGLIVIVAGIGVMVSIYNSMSDRRREIAIMRSLGARRSTVLTIVLLESILLSLGGGLLGVVLGHGLLAVLSPWAAAHTGVSLGAWQFVWYELVLIPALVVLASLVGYLPALTAYRTDVAKALVSG